MSKRLGDRGAVAVEFALVLPILLMLVFGIIDFGYMINRDTMINNVSRDAVRVGSLDGTYAQIYSTVSTELAGYGIPAAKSVITIDCTKPDGSGCGTGGVAATYDANAQSGGTVTVKIAYTHSWITPTAAVVLQKTVVLSKSTTMRIE